MQEGGRAAVTAPVQISLGSQKLQLVTSGANHVSPERKAEVESMYSKFRAAWKKRKRMVRWGFV